MKIGAKTFTRPVLSFLLSLVFLLSLFAFPVSAVAASFSLSGADSVILGENVNITVEFSSSEMIGAWRFALTYDPSVLEYVSGADSGGDGTVLFCDSSDGITSYSRTVVFKAKKTGSVTLSVSNAQVVSFESVSNMSVSGASKVISVLDAPVSPSPEEGTFYVESAQGKAGDTVVVKVKIKDNPGIVSFKVDLAFDSGVLELVSMEEGDFAGTVFGKDLTVNPVPMNWFDGVSSNNMTNGTLAILTFRIMDNAGIGQTPITLTFDEDNVFDSENHNSPFAVENGWVEITEYILGDANEDGKVNNKDLVAIQRYINSWGNSINLLAADYNEDGKINNKDLVAIQRFINGWYD